MQNEKPETHPSQTAKFVDLGICTGQLRKEAATEFKMATVGGERTRRAEMQLPAQPAYLNENKIRKRLYVLVIDRPTLAYRGDDLPVRCGFYRQIPERGAIAAPVGVRNAILQDTEDVELVRIAHAMRSGEGQRVQPVRKLSAIVEQYGGKNRILVFMSVQPTFAADNIVRKHRMIDTVGIAEGVVSAQLFITSGIMEQRRQQAHFGRLGIHSLAFGYRLGIGDNHIRMVKFERHHRRQPPVFEEAVDIFAIKAADRIFICHGNVPFCVLSENGELRIAS